MVRKCKVDGWTVAEWPSDETTVPYSSQKVPKYQLLGAGGKLREMVWSVVGGWWTDVRMRK